MGRKAISQWNRSVGIFIGVTSLFLNAFIIDKRPPLRESPATAVSLGILVRLELKNRSFPSRRE
jgi:hypothetical protein